MRGFFDAEGGISKVKNSYSIKITNTNKELIHSVFNLMQNLGFENLRQTKEKAPYSSKIVYRIISGRRYNILLFDKKIGFSIKRKRTRLKEAVLYLSKLKHWRWSSQELAFLKENHKKISNIEISKRLGRTIASAQHKANELGLKKTTKWNRRNIINELKNTAKIIGYSPTESDLIKLDKNGLLFGCINHFGSLNRAKEASGLKVNCRRWTNEEKEFLKLNFDKLTIDELKKKLDRSEKVIRNMHSFLRI